MNRYNVFKENVVVEEESFIRFDEWIDITEDIKKQNDIFIESEKIYAEVTFEIQEITHKLYRLFNEAPINKKTGKPGENSRISFMKKGKFPDGCFFLIDYKNKKIHCYICELKHRPGDKVLDIAEQFYSGFIHCKTFFAAICLDEEYEITYQYKIIGFVKEYEKYEKQLISNGVIKTPPGVLPTSSHKLRAYLNYKSGKIYYSYVRDYSKKIEFPFEFIQLIDSGTRYGPIQIEGFGDKGDFKIVDLKQTKKIAIT